jgi:hypothetical protein
VIGHHLWAVFAGCLVDLALCALAVRLHQPFSDAGTPTVTCSCSSSTSPVSISCAFSGFLVADVFLHGDWNLAASGLPSDDPEIASLSAEFRARAAQSRAPATLSTYMGPWQKFKSWCLEKNVPYLPARPLTVALYFTKILRSATSPSPVLSCSGAIFLHHHLAGLPFL